jgi:hypothetical protein
MAKNLQEQALEKGKDRLFQSYYTTGLTGLYTCRMHEIFKTTPSDKKLTLLLILELLQK